MLYALDASNNIIATNTLTNSEGGFLLGTLGLSTAQPISRFTVLPLGCSIGGTGGACNDILNLDSLVLETPAPVPEPSLLLPILGMLSLALVKQK